MKAITVGGDKLDIRPLEQDIDSIKAKPVVLEGNPDKYKIAAVITAPDLALANGAEKTLAIGNGANVGLRWLNDSTIGTAYNEYSLNTALWQYLNHRGIAVIDVKGDAIHPDSPVQSISNLTVYGIKNPILKERVYAKRTTHVLNGTPILSYKFDWYDDTHTAVIITDEIYDYSGCTLDTTTSTGAFAFDNAAEFDTDIAGDYLSGDIPITIRTKYSDGYQQIRGSLLHTSQQDPLVQESAIDNLAHIYQTEPAESVNFADVLDGGHVFKSGDRIKLKFPNANAYNEFRKMFVSAENNSNPGFVFVYQAGMTNVNIGYFENNAYSGQGLYLMDDSDSWWFNGDTLGFFHEHSWETVLFPDTYEELQNGVIDSHPVVFSMGSFKFSKVYRLNYNGYDDEYPDWYNKLKALNIKIVFEDADTFKYDVEDVFKLATANKAETDSILTAINSEIDTLAPAADVDALKETPVALNGNSDFVYIVSMNYDALSNIVSINTYTKIRIEKTSIEGDDEKVLPFEWDLSLTLDESDNPNYTILPKDFGNIPIADDPATAMLSHIYIISLYNSDTGQWEQIFSDIFGGINLIRASVLQIKTAYVPSLSDATTGELQYVTSDDPLVQVSRATAIVMKELAELKIGYDKLLNFFVSGTGINITRDDAAGLIRFEIVEGNDARMMIKKTDGTPARGVSVKFTDKETGMIKYGVSDDTGTIVFNVRLPKSGTIQLMSIEGSDWFYPVKTLSDSSLEDGKIFTIEGEPYNTNDIYAKFTAIEEKMAANAGTITGFSLVEGTSSINSNTKQYFVKDNFFYLFNGTTLTQITYNGQFVINTFDIANIYSGYTEQEINSSLSYRQHAPLDADGNPLFVVKVGNNSSNKILLLKMVISSNNEPSVSVVQEYTLTSNTTQLVGMRDTRLGMLLYYKGSSYNVCFCNINKTTYALSEVVYVGDYDTLQIVNNNNNLITKKDYNNIELTNNFSENILNGYANINRSTFRINKDVFAWLEFTQGYYGAADIDTLSSETTSIFSGLSDVGNNYALEPISIAYTNNIFVLPNGKISHIGVKKSALTAGTPSVYMLAFGLTKDAPITVEEMFLIPQGYGSPAVGDHVNTAVGKTKELRFLGMLNNGMTFFRVGDYLGIVLPQGFVSAPFTNEEIGLINNNMTAQY